MSLAHKHNNHVIDDPDDSMDSGRSRPSDRRKMIQIPVPWSTKFLTIRNYDVCFIVLVAMGIIGGYYLKDIQDVQTSILNSQIKVLESLEVQTYVLTLPPEQRDSLNIQMPDALRKKVRPILHRNYDE